MKTVLLVRNAAKGDFGGAETYPVSLAKLLKSEGYKPLVVTRSRKLLDYANQQSVATVKGWWWSRQDWSGKKTLLVPFYVLWQVILVFWYMILIIKTGAAVIHLQSKDDFIAGTLAGRLLGRKVVWTDHMDLRYILQNLTKPLKNPVGKIVFRVGHLSHHIILISKNEHRLVTSHFKDGASLKKQIVLIRNGVTDVGYTPKSGHNNPFIFCIASRLVVNKGVGEAIRAFKLLEGELGKKTLEPNLAIYGDGPDVEMFRKIAGDNDAIKFYGHQDNAIEKIRSADVFILPSYQEGLSIALLEATMLGKAIIASNVDSNPEIIIDNKTGVLFEVRNVIDLKDAMKELLTNNSLRQKLERGSRRNYEENFNLAKIVREEIIPIYND